MSIFLRVHGGPTLDVCCTVVAEIKMEISTSFEWRIDCIPYEVKTVKRTFYGVVRGAVTLLELSRENIVHYYHYPLLLHIFIDCETVRTQSKLCSFRPVKYTYSFFTGMGNACFGTSTSRLR